jgi:hypothetical protein
MASSRPSCVLFCWVLFCVVTLMMLRVGAGVYPDLPQPSPNVIAVPAGSLVIPMDTRQNSGGVFNLACYGAVINLLYNNTPVYWAIRAGKGKDEADFIALTSPVLPKANQTVTYNSYSGGPFIVPAQYAASAIPLIQAWDSTIVVHKLATAASIDVRHYLLHKPFVFLSAASNAYTTQENVLKNAKLVAGVHYNIFTDSQIQAILNGSTCYTIFTEPHLDTLPDFGPNVVNFLQGGGNVLVQCAGVQTYETALRLTTQNSWQLDNNNNENLVYPNPDTPISQFVGPLEGNCGGYLEDFFTNGTLHNDLFSAVHNNLTGTKVSDPGGATVYISTGAKIGRTYTMGGMLWYLGCHDWSGMNTPTGINGQRIYMNAIMTPSTRPACEDLVFCPDGALCPTLPCYSCVCSNNRPVLTPISGCCFNDSDCTGCQVCNLTSTGVGACTMPPDCCFTDSDCGACQTCTNEACVDIAGCCTSDSECGDCELCTNNVCVSQNCSAPAPPPSNAAVIGGAVGGSLGALGALGALGLVVAAAAAILLLRARRTTPLPPIVPATELTEGAEEGGQGNPMFESNVTTQDNSLFAGNTNV